MTEFSDALTLVTSELESTNIEERNKFLRYFKAERDVFAEYMARAIVVWDLLDKDIKGDKKKAYVVGLVWCAITLHIISMKLLMSGDSIPAGNLQRQVLETISLACLCSDKDLGIIASLMSFSEGGLYLGSSFDTGKLEAYKKDVDSRVSLAKVFENFIEGVRNNIRKWKD
jgi:hypothetical protein